MKQFLRLFGTLALVLALSAPALAVDIRVSGSWDFAFQKGDMIGQDDSQSDFWARQRVRTYMDFIVSETLKGTLAFEIGESNWGNLGENDAAGQGFSIGADGVSVEVKRAYIDWLVPNTMLHVRMGLQGIALPAAVAGSPVLDDDMAGIMLAYEFNEMFAANLFWARLYDDTGADGFQAGITESDNVDVFGLVLPINVDGASITPYGLYLHGGKQATWTGGKYGATPLGENVDAWWLGVAVEITALDPFVIKFDGIYGKGDAGDYNTDGFFLAAAVDYKMEHFTPGIFAFYGSGADEDYKGWMPVISPSGFGPTSFATDGAFGIDKGAFLTSTGTGLWGVGVQLADISFIEDLSHVLRFTYYQGTNDKNPIGTRLATTTGSILALATNESAWEINLDSYWNIYGDNLIAALELAYLGLDYNSDMNTLGLASDGAWRIAVALQYNF